MTAWFDPQTARAGAVQLDLPLPLPLPLPVADKPFAPAPAVRNVRQIRGRNAYLSGLAAEDAVVKIYEASGLDLLARRWRGSRAEIDLILRDGSTFIFVEVKKSRSFDAALLSLGRRQCLRITQAASEYLGERNLGQMTAMRFDLAMMNDAGAVEIVENAFAEDD